MAGRLLAHMEKQCREKAVEAIFLEVDEGNSAALGLYRMAGFTLAGRRKAYYAASASGSGDALVMRKTLAAKGA